MAVFKPAEPVYEVAAKWRDECLIRDGSMFIDEPLWTPENVAHLDRYYAQNLDEGEGKFWSKLEGQLSPAPADAIKLASEMFWAMYLYVHKSAMKGGTKRLQIKRVWEWSGDPLPDRPELLGAVLDHGIGHPGTAYNTHRWREFLFFVQLLQKLKAFPETRRKEITTDPWGFAGWMDSMEESSGRQLRHILLCILFPQQFERIASTRHKRDIVKGFYEKWGKEVSPVDSWDRLEVDRRVLQVRERALEEYATDELDFYQEPFEEVWRDTDSGSEDVDESKDSGEFEDWYSERFGDRRVWLLSAGEGARLWPEFKRQNLIAIGLDELGDLSEYRSKDEIRSALQESRGVENPMNDTLAGWEFATKMEEGDYVIAKRGRSQLLGIGVVESPMRHEPTRSEYRNVRDVEWRTTGKWGVPKERWITNKTLTDFTDFKKWLHDFVRHIEEGRPIPTREEPSEATDGYPMEAALDGLFMDADDFAELLDTWSRRKNLILEGPPGTGKTFIARRLARRLIDAKDPDRVEMVQFHQSYAYEDFVQGWRPTEGRGFELRNGVFFEFARKADADPDRKYVFIIDEINRGNLSRIFGELMMLIEGDKRGSEFSVPLTYSETGDRFHVPDNLYLLGLMNTADRSLAMVDYALRRRFAFRRMEPAFQTDPFSDFLLEAGVDEELIRKIEGRMTELNAEIRSDRTNLGPGFEIGHSYFVPTEEDDSVDEVWYERVIRSEIEPLLREYWFDQQEKVDAQVSKLLAP